MKLKKIAFFLKAMIPWLKTPSTQKGIITILAGFGLVVTPQHFLWILMGMTLTLGAYNMIRNVEKASRDPKDHVTVDMAEDDLTELISRLSTLQAKAAKKRGEV